MSSSDGKTRTPVLIYGQHYIITGTEPSVHVKHVAELVDKKMNEIRSLNPSLDTAKLAVLTAVNALNEKVKMEERIEYLETELSRLKD